MSAAEQRGRNFHGKTRDWTQNTIRQAVTAHEDSRWHAAKSGMAIVPSLAGGGDSPDPLPYLVATLFGEGPVGSVTLAPSTEAKLPLQNVKDSFGEWGYSGGDDEITIPVTGLYRASAGALVSTADGVLVNVYWGFDGTQSFYVIDGSQTSTVASTAGVPSLQFIGRLNAGQKLSVLATQYGGVDADTCFARLNIQCEQLLPDGDPAWP